MKRVISFLNVVILFSFLTVSITCTQESPSQNIPNSTNLTGAYLGQDPPGLQIRRFPPENFSANSNWFWHGPLSFSPDGTEIFMTKYLNNGQMQINCAKIENGVWTLLDIASFAGSEGENNPFIFVDGSKLYFISSRSGGHFWISDRTSTGWSNPRVLNIPSPNGGGFGWQMSVALDQSIYFDYMIGNDFYIYVARYVNGVYQTPEQLPDNINVGGAFCPFIDPDEDYLIFCSSRLGGFGGFDLYISFQNEAGIWQPSINMGNVINTGGTEVAPYVTIDGNYLFFFTERSGDSGYNPYWISADVINTLR